MIECLITLGLVVLLLMLSSVFGNRFICRQQSLSDLNQLRSTLAFARHQAVVTNTPVVICASANHHSCIGDWSQGYIAFLDCDGSHQPNTNNPRIRLVTALKRHAQLYWVGFRGVALTFQPTGILAAASGHFSYCPTTNRKQLARRLVISRTGRTRLTKTVLGDC